MKDIKIIFLGASISTILTMLLILIFSLVLANTNFNESYIDCIVTIISGVSLLIGSSISAKKLKKRGSIAGGVISIIYMLILYIISSFIGGNFCISVSTIIMFAVGIVLGIIGGIIGVNIN